MNDQERIEYFKEQIARLSNQVVDLLNERDALAAQVESCNDALKTLLKSLPWIGGSLQADGQFYYKVAESVFKKAESALAKTPQQALAEIRAEAVIAAIDAHKNNVMTFGFDSAIKVTDLIKYAAKVRQGGE